LTLGGVDIRKTSGHQGADRRLLPWYDQAKWSL